MMNKINFAIGLTAIICTIVLQFFVTRLIIKKRERSGKLAGNLSASLHDEKLKSSIIINAIDDGVVLLDEQMTIRLFNPAAEHITGWKCDEALGLNYQSVIRLVDDKDNPYSEDSDPFGQTHQTAQPIHDNHAAILSKDNKRISLSLNISPLIDENQKVTAMVAVFRDISESRQQEQQRAEFISTASHEMRTPVAAIEGYLALALNDKVSTVDSRARGYLEKAHASTEHLGKLFQDLLTSAKAEDGRLSNHPSIVEMGEYLEQLTQDLRFAAEKKGLFVEFVVGSNDTIDASSGQNRSVVRPLYYIMVDPDRLREVVTNLFDNAVKYSESGKISLGLTGNDHIVQMYVRDTGAGIPQNDIPHLFQKFYRVDNSSTRSVGGTGLGLFICRKIVELYQGKIWVESTLGKGSTFFINFPRVNQQDAARQKLAAEQAKLTVPTF